MQTVDRDTTSLTFARSAGYEAEIQYRAFISRETHASAERELRSRRRCSGYDPNFRHTPRQSEPRSVRGA